MQCPIDTTQLQMTSREGIEIDYCPQCRGVWLDRGELDKLIERASPSSSTPYKQPSQQRPYNNDDDDDYSNHNHHDDRGQHHDDHRKHKKESFLGDLFDF